jgi:hypothetical protein
MSAKPASPAQRPTRKKSKASGIIKVASLGLAGLIAGLLSGCTVTTASPALTSYSNLVGNWQFTSNSILPALAGNLTVNGSQVSGTLHPFAITSTTLAGAVNSHAVTAHATSCASTASFPVTGNVDTLGKITLTSSNFSGGTLALTGSLSSSQTALTNATIGVTNGTCALATTQAISSKYDTINGTYNGTIYSDAGTSLYVSTVFTQTTQPDPNGTYHLQGNSTFGSLQPCLPIPPTVSDSAVTGSTLAATYTESPNGTPITVVVDATFTPNASALTLNSYHITGGYCDGDSGHGTLLRQ